jgi:hypothetical protein
LATPPVVQTALRLAAAVATLALAVWAHRAWPRGWAAAHAFTLAAIYLMLFNPRTENNTYSCLAPAIGLWFAVVWHVPGARWTSCLLALIAVMTVGGYSLGRLLAPSVPPVWMAPLAGSIFACYAVARIAGGPRAMAAPPQDVPVSRDEPVVRLAA